MDTKSLKVAIVHDWLTNLGGAERTILAIRETFPQADIYTSVYNKEKLPEFHDVPVKTSFLQGWPMAKTRHQFYSRLRQIAFESFDFSDYDLVISTSTGEAKGVLTSPKTLHIGYIHTPTRYYWVDYEGYLAKPGFGLLNPVVRLVLPRWIDSLKYWDFAAAQRPDVVMSNSQTVAERVHKYYQRDSLVLYPPVQTARFAQPKKSQDGDYFLLVSRLVPYKNVRLAVEAFNKHNDKLVVIGDGSERKKLEAIAGPNVEFLGWADDQTVVKRVQDCRAFVFPTEEDFGITVVEAMAAGKPVIAYKKGGATETVVEGQTGVFFDKQTPQALCEAVQRIKNMSFNNEAIMAQAEKFSQTRFKNELLNIVEQSLAAYHNKAKL
ncbi:MAG TPA: glycosyltransferase [Gammaproteobacteria bacterium]|nr:glycosyltransferase [Gammaproteobacteria bacterium]